MKREREKREEDEEGKKNIAHKGPAVLQAERWEWELMKPVWAVQ